VFAVGVDLFAVADVGTFVCIPEGLVVAVGVVSFGVLGVTGAVTVVTWAVTELTLGVTGLTWGVIGLTLGVTGVTLGVTAGVLVLAVLAGVVEAAGAAG
jgi:hypothetical protein